MLLLSLFCLLFSAGAEVIYRESNTITIWDGDADALAVADMDGDGINDVVVASDEFDSVPSILLFRGQGSGLFAFPPRVLYSIDQSSGNFAQIVVEDMNQDGRLDVVVAARYLSFAEDEPVLYILLNQGDTFEVVGLHDVTKELGGDGVTLDPTFSRPFDVVVADMNNDGRLDMVAPMVDFDEGLLVVYESTSNDARSYTTKVVFDGLQGLTKVDVADFDNDGNMDIVAIARERRALFVFAGSESGSFASRFTDLSALSYFDVTTGDINKDGLTDIMTSGEAKMTLYENTGSFSFQELNFDPPFSVPGARRYVSPYLSDMNDDGLVDMVACGGVNNFEFIPQCEPNVLCAWGDLFEEDDASGFISPETTMILADVDQDGVRDILTIDDFKVRALLGINVPSTTPATPSPVAPPPTPPPPSLPLSPTGSPVTPSPIDPPVSPSPASPPPTSGTCQNGVLRAFCK